MFIQILKKINGFHQRKELKYGCAAVHPAHPVPPPLSHTKQLLLLTLCDMTAGIGNSKVGRHTWRLKYLCRWHVLNHYFTIHCCSNYLLLFPFNMKKSKFSNILHSHTFSILILEKCREPTSPWPPPLSSTSTGGIFKGLICYVPLNITINVSYNTSSVHQSNVHWKHTLQT